MIRWAGRGSCCESTHSARHSWSFSTTPVASPAVSRRGVRPVRIGVAGVGAVVVTFAAWATPAIAQRYPLLDSTAVAMLSGEISGDAAYDHVRVLSGFHRPQGSDTLGVAARYVE